MGLSAATHSAQLVPRVISSVLGVWSQSCIQFDRISAPATVDCSGALEGRGAPALPVVDLATVRSVFAAMLRGASWQLGRRIAAGLRAHSTRNALIQAT